MNTRPYDVLIIGGGIVGLATALELVQRIPGVHLAVIEKEERVASHQTGHNSGVIHSGLYYKPGSLKARLCVKGAAMMANFCRDHELPYSKCGKVVVATKESELPALLELFRRGTENGVPGLRMIGPEELREIEPHAAGIRGIHVPGCAITDYAAVASKYSEIVQALGGEVRTGSSVRRISRTDRGSLIETTKGEFLTKFVVNCAGLQADLITKLEGTQPEFKVVPFRGEYYEIAPERGSLVRGLIYPVPDPRYPFLGVHFTTRVHGGVEAGPNAVLAMKREGYTRSSFNVGDLWEFATYPGMWRLARKHWRTGAAEYYRSLWKPAFVRALQKLVPDIRSEDLKPGGAGVRAMLLRPDGNLADDFEFVTTEHAVHVCNVPSPAATASLTIAQVIADKVQSATGLEAPNMHHTLTRC